MSVIAELEQYVANPDGALKFMIGHDKATTLLAEINALRLAQTEGLSFQDITARLVKKPGTTGL